MRLAFEGLKANIDVPDHPAFLAALKAAAIDWPFHRVETDEEPIARIIARGTSLVVHHPEEEPVPTTPVAAACDVMVSLAGALVTENPHRLCLHGAAALFAGRLLVFPGHSHAGKSTLTARLAADGHTIFGDDIVPLDERGDGVALGVAPRLRLPLPASATPAFRDFVMRHAGASDGRYHYLALPEGRLARKGTTAPIGAIVLLDRQLQGPAELHAAPRSLALKLLARQNVSYAEDARPLLAQMSALVQRLPCYVLAYADLEEAAEQLASAFGRWPAAPQRLPLADPDALSRRLLQHDLLAEADIEADQDLSCEPYRPGMRLVRNPDVTMHEVEGEAFLAGVDHTAAINNLNPVALGIWNLMIHPVDEAEAAYVLSGAFPETDPHVIARDVSALFQSLHDSRFAIEATGPRPKAWYPLVVARPPT